jgi:hypothetical protein
MLAHTTQAKTPVPVCIVKVDCQLIHGNRLRDVSQKTIGDVFPTPLQASVAWPHLFTSPHIYACLRKPYPLPYLARNLQHRPHCP